MLTTTLFIFTLLLSCTRFIKCADEDEWTLEDFDRLENILGVELECGCANSTAGIGSSDTEVGVPVSIMSSGSDSESMMTSGSGSVMTYSRGSDSLMTYPPNTTIPDNNSCSIITAEPSGASIPYKSPLNNIDDYQFVVDLIYHEAQSGNFLHLTHLLIRHSLSPNLLVAPGQTLLSHFVDRDDLAGVQFVLDFLHTDINYVIPSGLYYDVALRRCRSVRVFRYLIHRHADPNSIIHLPLTGQFFSLLHYAVASKAAWMVKELIAAGAKESIVDNYGRTAREAAEMIGDDTIVNCFINRRK